MRYLWVALHALACKLRILDHEKHEQHKASVEQKLMQDLDGKRAAMMSNIQRQRPSQTGSAHTAKAGDVARSDVV